MKNAEAHRDVADIEFYFVMYVWIAKEFGSVLEIQCSSVESTGLK